LTLANTNNNEDTLDRIIIDGNTWYGIRSHLADLLLQKSLFHYNEFKVEECYNKLIYHYTNIDSFKSIIKSQCIHATNISYVNDLKELNYAQNLFIKNIKRIIKKRTATLENKILHKLLPMYENIEKSNRFISCFSIDGDLEYQWKQYGVNGSGISVGFAPHKLKDTLDPISSTSYIVYDKKMQEKMIDYYIQNILDFFITRYNLFDWNGYDPIYLIAKEIFEYSELYLCKFKSNSYKNEKEYRLEIKTDFLPNYHPFHIEFKDRNGIQIPFIANKTDIQRRIDRKYDLLECDYKDDVDFEYQMKKLPVEEIIIGYNLDFSDTKIQLSEFLEDHKYYDVNFKNSKYSKS
jgi:hypothetical protein